MAIKESNRLEYQGLQSDNVVQTTGDSITDVMSQKAVTDALVSAGGGVEEAPVNGKQHARKDEDWVEIESSNVELIKSVVDTSISDLGYYATLNLRPYVPDDGCFLVTLDYDAFTMTGEPMGHVSVDISVIMNGGTVVGFRCSDPARTSLNYIMDDTYTPTTAYVKVYEILGLNDQGDIDQFKTFLDLQDKLPVRSLANIITTGTVSPSKLLREDGEWFDPPPSGIEDTSLLSPQARVAGSWVPALGLPGSSSTLYGCKSTGWVAIPDQIEATQSYNNFVRLGSKSIVGANGTAVGIFAGARTNTSGTTTGTTCLGYLSVSFTSNNTNNKAVNCTGLGALSLSGNASGTITNRTGVGYDSQVTGDNQLQLGNSASTVYAYGAVQDRSDARDKADVRDTELGLSFIMGLRPVDFKWDMREYYRTEKPEPEDFETEDQYDEALLLWSESNKLRNITHDGSKKRIRYHHGLIAQEVKELIDNTGIDFGGFQDHTVSGGDDVLSLGYNELIAPLIKAIQEQQLIIEQLRSDIDALLNN